MTQIAYPLDNTSYTAKDVRLFHVARYSGIFNTTGTDLEVSSAGGLVLTVKPGYAFLMTGTNEIGGITYGSSSNETITVDTPSTTKRYDYVSVRYTKSTNTCVLKYVKGNANKPTSPVRNTGEYEIIIAIIEVPANASSISASNIQDTRLNKTFCGLVVDGTERIPIEGLQAQFEAFMDSIKSTLDGDTAGNLLNKINANTARIVTLEGNVSTALNDINALKNKVRKITLGYTEPVASQMELGEIYLQLKASS